MTTTTQAPTLSCIEREALELADRIIKRGGVFYAWNAADVRNVTESLKPHIQYEPVRVALQLVANSQ